jgi:hypothetical protein
MISARWFYFTIAEHYNSIIWLYKRMRWIGGVDCGVDIDGRAFDPGSNGEGGGQVAERGVTQLSPPEAVRRDNAVPNRPGWAPTASSERLIV